MAAVGTPEDNAAIVECMRVPQNQSIFEISHLTSHSSRVVGETRIREVKLGGELCPTL